MRRKSVIIALLALAAGAVFLLVANAGSTPQRDSAQSSDLALATFAGGCFWCVEADFDKVPGVEETISGYMGGHVVDPDYAQVSRGDSGHREVVQVRYDPARITYDGLLAAFWRMIDPTDVDGQFVDRGPQYTSAIYYHDEAQRAAAERSLQALSDSGRHDGTLVTPILPAETFYRAEEYHQDFYQRSAIRYRFYRHRSGRDQYLEATWGDDLEVDFSRFAPAAQGNTRRWHRPPDDELRARLTPLQYRVTQRDATEPAYENPYWDNRRPGIYVDIVTGEPLFSSLDQYDSGTGWPSFTRPLEADHIITRRDFKLFIPRTEVRSRHGDSHLGHVFRDGPQPTGLRYCINSAAMRFVPLERLAEEGYGDYLDLFSDG